METEKTTRATMTDILEGILFSLERNVKKATYSKETIPDFERGIANGQLAQAYEILNLINKVRKSDPLVYQLKTNIQTYMLDFLTKGSDSVRTTDLNTELN